MYEPVILEKKKHRTIAGTPAGKFTVFTNCLKIVIPIGSMFLISPFILKRRKIITELDEYDPTAGRIGLLMELYKTADYWNKLGLQGVIKYVLEESKNNEELLKNIPPAETSKVDT